MHPPHDAPPSNARVVRCSACGGAFSPSAPHSTCPFCRADVHVDPRMWQALRQYGERIAHQQERAREHLQHVAAWKQAQDSMRPGNYLPYLLFIVGFAVVAPAVAMAWQRLGNFDQLAFTWGTMIVFYGVVLTWTVSHWRRWARRKQNPQAPETTHTVACPGCGARSELQAGAAHRPCPYCGVALIASGTIILQAEDAAHQIARAAELARYRTEREGMRTALAMSQANIGLYMGLGYGGLLTLLTLTAVSVQTVKGVLAWTHAVVAWLIAGILVSATVLLFQHLRRRRERLYTAAEDLAHQFHGRVHRDLQPLVAWLNHYWVGPYDLYLLHGSTGYLALTSEGLGHPVLLDVNLTSADKYRGPRLQVLVATDVPEAIRNAPATWTDHTQAIRRYLRTQGFESHVEQAGIRLVAEGRIIKHLRRNPDALHAMAPILRAGVDLALSVQGRPVAPVP